MLLETIAPGTSDFHSHETGRQENDRVDKTDDPAVTASTINTELLRERQIRAVRSSLIPTLCSSSNSAEPNRVPEHFRTVPFVVAFVYQRSALVPGKVSDLFEARLIASDKCSGTEEGCMFAHSILFREGSGIGNHLLWRFALKRTQALVGVLKFNGGAWPAKLSRTMGEAHLQRVLDDVQRD